ncbi:MAG: FG-GAP-like repeat-containing protein, partial [Tannerella sp.]|nr:FG-GAP-like repeat-containing protein [Tannerella sp.]
MLRVATAMAQDTDFWFVAPHPSASTNAWNYPTFFMLTNASDYPTDITITIRNGGSPIVINQTIPVGGYYKHDFLTAAATAQVENPRGSAGSVTDFGVHITSTHKINAYYMINVSNTRDIFTLKGQPALGTEFFVPMQSDNYFPNGGAAYPGACDQIDIVASEDNTLVTIVPTAAVKIGGSSSAAGVALNYTLDKGKTLKIMENATNGIGPSLPGTHITSDKPVAVTVIEDLVNGDTSGDQIAPVSSLGTTYLVAKGYQTNYNHERVYIVATKNGTNLAIDGTTVASSMSAGQTYVYSGFNAGALTAILVHANEPVYCYQRTGLNEQGAALLPSIFSINQHRITFFEISSYNEKAFVVFRSGAENSFTINYNGVTSALNVGTPITVSSLTGWSVARFDLPTAARDKVVTIANPNSVFSLGYIAANPAGQASWPQMTSYGNFSTFGNKLQFTDDTVYFCPGSYYALDGGYALSYDWERPDGSHTTGTDTIHASQHGLYRLTVDYDPELSSDSIWVFSSYDFKAIASSVKYHHYSDGDSMIVTFDVTNLGYEHPDSLIYSIYKGNVTAANRLAADSLKRVFYKDDTVTLRIKITDYSLKSPDILTVSINDRGGGAFVNPECDVTNNQFSFRPLITNNDYYIVFNNTSQTQTIKINDTIPAPASTTATITVPPLHGTATLLPDGTVRYTPASGYVGADIYTYALTDPVSGMTDTARVRIVIYEYPDNVNDTADCHIAPPTTSIAIEEITGVNTTAVITYNQPVVGDVDGDGITEIVVPNNANSGLLIFKGNNLSAAPKAITSTATTGHAHALGLVRTKFDATKDTTFIIAHVSDGKFRAFSPFGTAAHWTCAAAINAAGYYGEYFYFVDFNGDGYVEIVSGTQIIDAATGIVIFNAATPTSGYSYFYAVTGHMTAVADVLNIGRPQLIAGNTVYDVNITNRVGTAGNTLTPLRTLPAFTMDDGTAAPVDGFTSVADFNLDGLPDVLVRYHTAWATTGKTQLYIWTPALGANGKVMATKTITGKAKANVPTIADIDGDKYPEIIISAGVNAAYTQTTSDSIYAFKYIPGNTVLQRKWALYTANEKSASAGISAFDFNQDGIAELVYHDDAQLRIINGSGSAPVALTTTTLGAQSYFKYPLIADIDNDGHAEIITNGATAAATQAGTLRIFRGPRTSPWAPARHVWNQYAYNPVVVNDDLTIPALPTS